MEPAEWSDWIKAQLRVRLRRAGKTMTWAASELGKPPNFLTRKLIPGNAKRALTFDDVQAICTVVLEIRPEVLFTEPIPADEIAAEDEWAD